MEIFNLLCISFVLLEYSLYNQSVPTYFYTPALVLHILTQYLYVWIVVASSLLECIFYYLRWSKHYMLFVPILDEYVVGTLLNVIVFSGVLVSKIKYGKKIPNHIQKVIQQLKNLGLFWFLLDKTSQQITFFNTFYLRVCINLFSCYQLFQIQSLMKKKIKK